MPLFSVSDLCKKFGNQHALENVSLTFEKGRVYGLVGENGAGKSTLIKIITGVQQADCGRILFEDREVKISGPHDAVNMGINVVHQNRNLIPFFNGMENIFLGSVYPRRKFRPGIDWHRMYNDAALLMDELGVNVPLKVPVSSMSPSDRTMIEIIRAIRNSCKLLFLDEPTASLTDKETKPLFRLIEKLRSAGTTIIYVSHRIDEVLNICDEVAVLKNGKNAGSALCSEIDRDSIIKLMSGETKTIDVATKKSPISSKTVLDVKTLSTRDNRVKNASLKMHEGEIVGMFGLTGAGRTEFIEAVYGLRKINDGEVSLFGKRLNRLSPKKSIESGMVMICEDRLSHEIIKEMSVRENMTLPMLDSFTKVSVIDRNKEDSCVKQWLDKLGIKTKGTEQKIIELSGGNQQKVVFAKVLISSPKILLCDEPTQGVDIATRYEIFKLLKQQADKGCSILYVSSDLNETLEIADRLVVMGNGRTVADLPTDNLSTDQVLSICYSIQEGEELQ